MKHLWLIAIAIFVVNCHAYAMVGCPTENKVVMVQGELTDNPQETIAGALQLGLEMLKADGYKRFRFCGYIIDYRARKIAVFVEGYIELEAQNGIPEGKVSKLCLSLQL